MDTNPGDLDPRNSKADQSRNLRLEESRGLRSNDLEYLPSCLSRGNSKARAIIIHSILDAIDQRLFYSHPTQRPTICFTVSWRDFSTPYVAPPPPIADRTYNVLRYIFAPISHFTIIT